jgi:hypothetical protein
MATAQIRNLATQLTSDPELRMRFRTNARAVAEQEAFGLSRVELDALETIDWGGMNDDEMLTRISGAFTRATRATA